MADLGPELLTLILFGTLVILLLAGLPLVFALGGTATLFIIFIWGPGGLAVLANRTYTAMSMFMLVAVPMFIFMGAMLQKSGIAEDLYDLMYHWMGGLRGGACRGNGAHLHSLCRNGGHQRGCHHIHGTLGAALHAQPGV